MKLFEERRTAYRDDYAKDLNASELWLAERCALTPASKWLVRDEQGVWTLMSAKAARLALKQNYGGFVAETAAGKVKITDNLIDDFMEDTVPVVHYSMKCPASTAPVIQAFERIWINTWDPRTMLQADGAALNDLMMRPKLNMILRMIRESLCARPNVLTLDEMIAVLQAKEPDPDEMLFRFVMFWLAAPLQEVGLNLQTNLWFIGELNGTGKGTLSLIMSLIYGMANSKLINEDELEKGGWSDVLDGALWLGWNEIKQQGGKNGFDYNSFIKQNSTEAIVQVRRRNMDSYSILNFSNWYITGNKENAPWGALDLYDRRNCIIATTDDASKLPIAKEVREWFESADNQEQVMAVLAGFRYLLQDLQIDRNLIARAPQTDLKTEMQQQSSVEADGLYWLVNDPEYPRDKFLPARAFLDSYTRFNAIDGKLSTKSLASKLSKFARKRWIEREEPKNKGQVLRFRISSEKYPVDGGVPNEDDNPGGNVVALLTQAKKR